MHIYLKNNTAIFHPDLIWTDGALGLFWTALPNKNNKNKKNNNKMSSNMGSNLQMNCKDAKDRVKKTTTHMNAASFSFQCSN